jgi:hypothetical protein
VDGTITHAGENFVGEQQASNPGVNQSINGNIQRLAKNLSVTGDLIRYRPPIVRASENQLERGRRSGRHKQIGHKTVNESQK